MLRSRDAWRACAASMALALTASAAPRFAPPGRSGRTLVAALEIDRDSTRLVAYTVKPRPFRAPAAQAPQPVGETVQVEVVLRDGKGERFTRRLDVGLLCLEHDPSTPAHVEGDTIRRHRDTFLVDLPELASADTLEVAYYRGNAAQPVRVALGRATLDAAHFDAAGRGTPYPALAFAIPGDDIIPPVYASGQVHWPEEYGDPDVYHVYGDAAAVEERINIVIVPDGYTYAQKATMQAHANAAVAAYRAKTPYKEHDPFLNYILVYAYSNATGTDQCDCDLVVDTAMNTRFPDLGYPCGHSNNRCLYYGTDNGGPDCDPNTSEANIVAAELRAPAHDKTLIMVNTSRYGGCAGVRAVFAGANSSAYEIAIHELGHALAGLDDEYGGSTTCGSTAGMYNTSLDPVNGNWPEWIPVLGAPLEAAKYYDLCIYRPKLNCDMRSLNQPFCEVCKQRWALVYFGHPRVIETAPVRSSLPVEPAISVDLGDSLSFSIVTRFATGAGVVNNITWSTQAPGEPGLTPAASGVTSFSHTFDTVGAHHVRCEVVADVNFIKPSKNGANVDTVDWTVYAGCDAAPLFSGIETAADIDPCHLSGIELGWQPAVFGASGGTYAVYRDGAVVASGLLGSPYTDQPGDDATHAYQVKAVSADCGFPDANVATLEAMDETNQVLPGAECGNDVCEAGNGEDCQTCSADCNGVQNGPPSGRYCCGAGGGFNPVPCSDPLCTANGNTCVEAPQFPTTSCCGDGICDGPEDCALCPAECTPGTEVCTGGADEDCDGSTDCDDSECAPLPICILGTLTVSKNGNGAGTVTSSPSGINCGSDCSEAYTGGPTVTLTATPGSSSVFAGWSGHADCADGVVTMTSDRACTATFNLKPDLQVTVLTVPATAGAGYPIAITDTTKNAGLGPAAASTTRFYLSANSAWDGGDLLLGGRAVPLLAPGAVSTAAISPTLPASVATGTWYVIARADDDGIVVETIETNNTRSASTKVGPDLIVSVLTVPAAAPGFTVAVTDTTKNQGGGDAAASVTRFYLSINAVLDSGDVVLDSRSVPALAPGGGSSVVSSLLIPPGTALGAYYLIAKADADLTVPETTETNNTRAVLFTVGADSVVSTLTAPASAGAGATITVTDGTKTQAGPVPISTVTRLYLSVNNVWDAGDTVLGQRTVPALAAGATSTGSTPVVIPADTAPGAYYLIALADADLAVAETVETNNTRASALTAGADLVVTVLTAPASAGVGATITITDSTKNQIGAVLTTSVTRHYLSTDSAWDAADVALGQRTVPPLGAAATSTGSTSVVVPVGTPTGSYHLIAKADADLSVAETVETNNTRSRAFTAGADLIVTVLTVPAAAGMGATITITDTTKNQGGWLPFTCVTRRYLSTDATWDAADVPLGQRVVPALGAGATSTGSATGTIPAETPSGDYFVIARADADETVPELIETNNTKVAPIKIGPDLIVTVLTAPATAGAGTTITITDTTKNQYGVVPIPTVTRHYLSTDAIWDAADTPLGERTVPALAAGASSSGSAAAAIPEQTPPGSYYLIALADGDGAVLETSETNNTKTKLVVIGPDLVVQSLTIPVNAGQGSLITVTEATKNQGGGAAAPSLTRLYLSANTILDAGDPSIGERAVPALAPAISSSASTACTIPPDTAPGSYFVIALSDAGQEVAETVESNNTHVSSSAMIVWPDLVVAALTVPASADAGTAIAADDTTLNQGAAVAGACSIGFYLSTDATFDAGDLLLGARAVGPLAAGASDAGSTSLAIPAGTAAGAYQVIARADDGLAVAEWIETNNLASAPIQIGP